MEKRTRQCYDTALIYLFILGKEHLLPAHILCNIPYSTKATWRTYVKNKFVGNTQQTIMNEGIRNIELYNKYKHIKKVLLATESIYCGVSDMLALVKIPLYQLKEHTLI